jgi:hypothetical protein
MRCSKQIPMLAFATALVFAGSWSCARGERSDAGDDLMIVHKDAA